MLVIDLARAQALGICPMLASVRHDLRVRAIEVVVVEQLGVVLWREVDRWRGELQQNAVCDLDVDERAPGWSLVCDVPCMVGWSYANRANQVSGARRGARQS